MSKRSLAPSRLTTGIGLFLIIVLSGGHIATQGAPAAPEVIRGAGNSGLNIVNLDDRQAADIHVDLYPHAGGEPIRIERPGVPPRSMAHLTMPAEATLAGGAYAAIIHSNRPVASLWHSHWPDSGATVMAEDLQAERELYLLPVHKGFVGQDSIVVIQNPDPEQAADVELEILAMGSDRPVLETGLSIEGGRSIRLDLAEHAALAGLPEGFEGWMRLRADRPVVAEGIENLRASQQGATHHPALPASRLESTHLAPMLLSRFGDGGRTSVLRLFNPGAESRSVEIDLIGLEGSCKGQRYLQGPISIAPFTSQGLPQTGAVQAAEGTIDLPEDCALAGHIRADGPLAASVEIRTSDGERAAGYAAALPRDAAGELMLPVVRRAHLQYGIGSAIHVQNTSDVQGPVRLELFDERGQAVACGSACQAEIEAGGALRWDLAQIEAFPVGIGHAVVTSQLGLVASLLETVETGDFDDSAYLALPIGEAQPSLRARPLMLAAGQQQRTATPRPSATPTGPSPTPIPGALTIFAIGFVDVAGGGGACPGCDGTFDPVDEAFARLHPLGSLRFEVRDADGELVAEAASEALETLQRAMLQVPPLAPDGYYDLLLVDSAEGYEACASEPIRRRIEAEDFALGNARQDFHFWTGCPPIHPLPTLEPSPEPSPGNFDHLGTSSLQVSNLGDAALAAIDVDFRAFGSGEVQTTTQDGPFAPGRVVDLLPPSASGRYSALARSDEPSSNLAVLARLSWPESGAALIYTAPEADRSLIVPWLARHAYRNNSALVLQNADPQRPVSLEIHVHEHGSITPLRSMRMRLPAAGSSLLRMDGESELAGVPDGFIGWLRIEAEGPVSAISLTEIAGQKTIHALPGFTPSELSDRMVLPMAYNFQFIESHDPEQPEWQSYSSEIMVMNPNPHPVDLRLEYRADVDDANPLGCRGLRIPEAMVTIEPGGSRWYWPPGSDLPNGCRASAWIQSDGGPVAAFAFVTDHLRIGTALAASPVDRGALRSFLPLVRKSHIADLLMNTPIHVANLGTEATDVELQIFDSEGEAIDCGPDCRARLAAGQNMRWWPSDIGQWPAGSVGSAMVIADQPLDVTAMDLSLRSTVNPAAYRALSLDRPAPRGLPLLLRNARIEDSGAVPTELGPPVLELPDARPDLDEGRLRVPLAIRSRGQVLERLSLRIEYDRSWLRLDPADLDADGRPDAIHPSDGLRLRVDLDGQAGAGRAWIDLEAEMEDGSALPDGTFVEIILDVIGSPAETGAWVGVAEHPLAVAWSDAGEPWPLELRGGWHQESYRNYLPLTLLGGATR